MFADVCSEFVIRLPLSVCRLYDSRPLASACGLVRICVLTTRRPTPQSRTALVNFFDGQFPSGDRQVDRELSHLLIVLEAPKVVDRLLQSTRYGEHMARYWLDAARYADSHGYHIDSERSQGLDI